MFNECLKRREEKTTIAYTLEEILKNLEEKQCGVEKENVMIKLKK